MTTKIGLWETYSGVRGWMLPCDKVSALPRLYRHPVKGKRRHIRNKVLDWHLTKGRDNKDRPKTLFFEVSEPGLYELVNDAKHGGYKLVYGDKFLRYITITPEEKSVVLELMKDEDPQDLQLWLDDRIKPAKNKAAS